MNFGFRRRASLPPTLSHAAGAMVRVAILGATGYTALELIKILLRHPEAEITTLTSRSEGNPHVASVHPQLAGRIDLTMADLGPTEIASRAEMAFSCLP